MIASRRQRRPRLRAGPAVLFACLLLGFATTVAAQEEQGRISGRIVDEETARPLSLAQIAIPSLNTGTLSDVDGRWTLKAIPAGTYEVTARLIGYASKTVTGVLVVAGDVVTIDISLPPQAIEMNELSVTVADQRGTASAVLANRQTAAAVTDAIGREQISDSPDSDAAAAMARVPGVSIVDKKFVFVRGLGERYGNTTLDGAVMPSPIADRKAVPLDLVPASFIENVSTSKSYLPRQPADYAGGLVQIETRKVPGENFFKVGLGTGMETATTGKSGLGYAGGGLDFLGIDDGLRALPDILFGLAESHYQSGEFETAIPYYSRIVSEFPDDTAADDSQYNLAWCLLELKREAEAMAAFRNLLETYPRSDFAAAAQFTLADDAYNRQSYEEAMLAYELVQARFPDDPVAAQVPRILSEIEEAIAYEHYEQAVALMDSAEAVEEGAARKQYFERAVNSFQDISSRYPGTESAIGALSNMGVCLEGLGKWRDAVEIYDQVIEMYEDKRASKEVFQFAKAHRDWIVSTRL